MPQQKLRFAVLGAGRIGRIHAANLATRIPRAEVVALADVATDALADLAARLGIARTFTDYRRALELADVDAVAVCTPTDTHYPILLDAASAGKHIFCEKPVDLEIGRIRHVNRHVAECGVQLMVAFNRRFDPNFAKVHELVRAGRVGVPHLIRITSRDPAPPPESYIRGSGGIFLDMTIHDFDMARFLAGSDVVEVFARAAVLVDPMFERAGDWDTAITLLSFASGALGAIDNSRKAVYGYDQRVEVFGSQGMVAVSNNTPDTHVLYDSTGAHASLPLHFFMERYTESYLREMQAFVEAVLDGKPVPVTGEDGLQAVRIALAAARSARERRPVPLDEIPA
ncbi:MAG: inositol 2-dehydrogenase [Bryobacterales bacterium]|nr:inositol 2-dehydrogenase [Bryobacteraceae bacterium]MDW8130846.1 inositol 2-dehydrogenase [Bryobacterales bacterium]